MGDTGLSLIDGAAWVAGPRIIHGYSAGNNPMLPSPDIDNER